MPIITLENVVELSKEQKQLLIKRLTVVTAQITGKNEKYIYVRIDEVPRENFGIGGKSLS
ncbi:MAG: 4-oxalocrotonate tautomerase family protein [Candidatus Celaenobacter polaris]|nr:4-oxalocrotonate tautomerase family protein [Candidatus Celaenobacter polaris]